MIAVDTLSERRVDVGLIVAAARQIVLFHALASHCSRSCRFHWRAEIKRGPFSRLSRSEPD